MKSFFAVLFLWSFTCSLCSYSQPLDQEEDAIMIVDYTSFLQEIASSDHDHLYDERMQGGSIMRIGLPGSYCYNLISSAPTDNFNSCITGLSWNEALQYCDWRNHSASTSTFNLNSCAHGAASIDPELRTNHLYFYLTDNSKSILQMIPSGPSTGENILKAFVGGLELMGFIGAGPIHRGMTREIHSEIPDGPSDTVARRNNAPVERRENSHSYQGSEQDDKINSLRQPPLDIQQTAPHSLHEYVLKPNNSSPCGEKVIANQRLKEPSFPEKGPIFLEVQQPDFIEDLNKLLDTAINATGYLPQYHPIPDDHSLTKPTPLASALKKTPEKSVGDHESKTAIKKEVSFSSEDHNQKRTHRNDRRNSFYYQAPAVKIKNDHCSSEDFSKAIVENKLIASLFQEATVSLSKAQRSSTSAKEKRHDRKYTLGTVTAYLLDPEKKQYYYNTFSL